MEVWIGTSGYAYADWVGCFYPPGTPATRMLNYYVTKFPLVELNYTFYRLPTPQELANLARKTPAGFQFVVKLHESITHKQDAVGVAPFRDAVEPLRQEGRLLGLLAQYPQSFHCSEENREHLERLADAFAGCGLAVEFRHASWNQPETVDWLQENNLHLVSVDVPEIDALYPRQLVQSGRLLYLRFHSRNRGNWYEGDKKRYDYLFSDEELQDWVNALANRSDSADRALVLFNNCHRGQSAVNAGRMGELLASSGPAFHIIEPFAGPPETEQRLLF